LVPWTLKFYRRELELIEAQRNAETANA